LGLQQSAAYSLLLLCRLSTPGMQLPLVLRTPSAVAGPGSAQPSVMQGLVQLLSMDEVSSSMQLVTVVR
jgi:hypothetical protein